MSDRAYPEFMTSFPEADVPVEGVRAWISQAVGHQTVFFDIDASVEIPPHTHGEQWGTVVEGEMELTIAGETRRCRPGDSYHIPAGTVHSARFLTRVRTIDVFAGADRWKTKVS